MRARPMRILLSAAALATLTGCAPVFKSTVSFPNPNDIFVTTGDGNIQKPYTPVGQLIYGRTGFRIPLPILALLPVADVDPSIEFREGILQEVKRMGGDGVINLSMNWTPPKAGFLRGLLGIAEGGSIVIYGTVIKR